MLALTFTWMLMLMLTIGIAVHNNAENDTPYVFWVWFWLGFHFFWEWLVRELFATFKRNNKVWMTRTPPPKMIDFYKFSLVREASDPVYEILAFLMTNFIFLRHNEISLWGKKRAAIFQTYIWEKSSFYNALICAFAEIYANMWQKGHIYPPTPFHNIPTMIIAIVLL